VRRAAVAGRGAPGPRPQVAGEVYQALGQVYERIDSGGQKPEVPDHLWKASFIRTDTWSGGVRVSAKDRKLLKEKGIVVKEVDYLAGSSDEENGDETDEESELGNEESDSSNDSVENLTSECEQGEDETDQEV
jgi:hypothetical protein